MRLHLGCAKRYTPGYINIDGAAIPGQKPPDIIRDLTKPLPFFGSESDEILAIHIFEHFYRGDVPGILSDWFRVLKPGGRLILEMPDIYKSAKNLIAEIDAGKEPSNKWAMWPLYGDNPNKTEYDCHKWGWTFKTLSPLLAEAGFTGIKEADTVFHGRKQNRDFRIQAVKP